MEEEIRSLIENLEKFKSASKKDIINYLNEYKLIIDSKNHLTDPDKCELHERVGEAIYYLENNKISSEAQDIAKGIKDFAGSEGVKGKIKEIEDAIKNKSTNGLIKLDEHFGKDIEVIIDFNKQIIESLKNPSPIEKVKDLLKQEKPCISGIDSNIKSSFYGITSCDHSINTGKVFGNNQSNYIC